MRARAAWIADAVATAAHPAGAAAAARTLACVAALALALACAPALAQTPETPVAPNSTCWTCHLEMEGDAGPAHGFADDVHAHAGLTCSDCHGGDPRASEVETAHDASWRGRPGTSEVPKLCGRCHSDAAFMRSYDPSLPVDQVEKYATSVHGQRLAGGDEKAAVCTSCHGVHGILPASHPRSHVYAQNIPATCDRCHGDAALMDTYGIGSDQFAEYRRSVHGAALLERGDLGAPACNDCHGNHGAAPPGVESVSHVCGSCHALNAEMFAASPHADAYKEAGIPQCEACHGNHEVAAASDSLLDAGTGVCSGCHGDGEPGLTAASGMLAALDSLRTSYDEASALLEKASHKGMEVSEAVFELKSARQALIEARTATHTVTLAKVTEPASKGREITRAAAETGRSALAAYEYRRRGLGISTLALSLFAIGLAFKIRQMESRNRSRS